EPDLCVAYGAALRAAGHGTRYVFSLPEHELELHVTSPGDTRDTAWHAAGVVRFGSASSSGESVRLRSLATGLVEEASLDAGGAFSCLLELEPETDTPIEWTVCDADGRERARVVTPVRHSAQGRPPAAGMLSTQLIAKPLAIEVLGRDRQRHPQVVAPAGAPLPGPVRCTGRTIR